VYICLCDCIDNSVHKRATTERPFTFESNWQDVGASRKKQSGTSKKKTTLTSQNTASGESRTNSNQVPRSQVTRSQVAVSSSASRKDGNKTATGSNLAKTATTSGTDSKRNNTATGNKQLSLNNASQENSAVRASHSTERLRNSAKSKDRFLGIDGSNTNDAGRKDANQSIVNNPKSTSHDTSRHNSAARLQLSSSSVRAQRQVKSRPGIAAAETNSTEPRSISANIVHDEALNTSGNVETLEVESESLHREAVNSDILTTTASRKKLVNKNLANNVASNKAKDVNLGENEVSGRSGVCNSTTNGDMPIVNSSLTSVAVSQQSVVPLSSETTTHKQASDAAGGAVGVDTVTLGNHSNVSSTRIQSLSQSGQTARNIHMSTAAVASSCKAVSSNTTSMHVMSGKTTVANGLNTRARSAAQIKQTSAVAETGSAAATSQLRLR